MNTFKKIALGLTAASIAAAPIAASAAQVSDLRALSAQEEVNEAGMSWGLILLGVAVIVGAIVIIANDSPSSP